MCYNHEIMRSLTLLRPEVAIPLIGRFFAWYIREPMQILKKAAAFSKAFNAILSIPFLLRTLLSPWKNIVEEGKGSPIAQFMEAMAMALVSRGVGFVIRTGAIILSLALQVGLLAFTVCYLALWILYPVVLLFVIAHVIFALVS